MFGNHKIIVDLNNLYKYSIRTYGGVYMKKIKFIAFKGISTISKIIRWWTGGDYSHIAIGLDDDNTIEAWKHENRNLKWGYFTVSENHTHGTQYEIWEVELPSAEYQVCMDFYKWLADNKIRYDFISIFCFVFRFLKNDNNTRFCSEGAVEPLINSCGWVGEPSKTHPSMFVDMIKEFGAVKVKESIT
jgi:hypothetical protein